MDIVEFAEKFMNVKLLEYQKAVLRAFDKLRLEGNIRVVTGRDGRSYIYLDESTREGLIRHG